MLCTRWCATKLPRKYRRIKEQSIPKTTSGKVQRRKTKAFFLQGDMLKVVFHWDNPNVVTTKAKDPEHPSSPRVSLCTINNTEDEAVNDVDHFIPDNTDIPLVALVNNEDEDADDDTTKPESDIEDSDIPVATLDLEELKRNAKEISPFTINDLAVLEDVEEEEEEEHEEVQRFLNTLEEEGEGQPVKRISSAHRPSAGMNPVSKPSRGSRKSGARKSSAGRKSSGSAEMRRGGRPSGGLKRMSDSRPAEEIKRRSTIRRSHARRSHARTSYARTSRGSTASRRGRRRTSIANQVMDLLHRNVPQSKGDNFDHHTVFDELGIDSVKAVEFANILNNELDIDLSPTILYSFPTVESLSKHIMEELSKVDPDRQSIAVDALKTLHLGSERGEDEKMDIAIVGYGCRLPGGIENLREFWGFLIENVDIVNISQHDKRHPDVFGGFMTRDHIELFDNHFFGLSKVEAQAMDPCQRLLLTTAWEALSMGGVKNKSELMNKDVGVYVGMSSSDYIPPKTTPAALLTTSVHSAIASNRISYVFGLTGPTMTIDTACSSSLVSMVEAMSAIRKGQCSSAIVGGAGLMHNPRSFDILKKAGFLSPTARCHTWDEKANGYVRSEGCVSLYMMPLKDALEKELPVLGVLAGGATCSDGRTLSLTAPNPIMQANLIKSAIKDAEITPSHVEFVEAHGTGTALGDPIEIEGLQKALISGTIRAHEVEGSYANPLMVSSAKGFIGHTEAAAGLVGVGKALLSLMSRQVPGNPNLHTTNPKLKLKSISLPQELEVLHDSEDYDKEIYCGVSSYGFGGSLAHVILSDSEIEPPQYIEEQAVSPVFLFSGQGGLEFHGGVIREVYQSNSVFRLTIDEIAMKMTNGLSPYTLHQLLGVSDGKDIGIKDMDTSSVDEKVLKEYAQPCVFAIQYALVETWKDRGVEPSFVMGHSLGEVAAACCAGVMTLDTAVKFILERFQAFNDCSEGAMMAIIAKSAELQINVINYILKRGQGVTISAYNGPRQTVVAGTPEDLNSLQEDLKNDYPEPNVRSKLLKTSGAFHSPLMKPAAKRLKSFMKQNDEFKLMQPAGSDNIQMVSSVTGKVETTIFQDPKYWSDQVTMPVLYQKGVETLSVDEEQFVCVEIGAGRSATTMFKHALPDQSGFVVLTSVPMENDHGTPDEHLRHANAIINGWARPEDKGHIWNYERFPLAAIDFQNPSDKMASPRQERLSIKASDIHNTVREVIAQLVSGTEVEDNTPFTNLGLDSMSLTSMAGILQEELQQPVSVPDLLNHSTVVKLCDWLISSKPEDGAEDLVLKPCKKEQGKLSSCQEQMYSHMLKFGNDSNMYNLPFAWELKGDFDLSTYKKAIWHLMDEHEAFRTGIRQIDNMTTQVVIPLSAYTDDSWLEFSEPREDPKSLMKGMEAKLLAPFDYENGPLFRSVVYKLSNDHYILGLCFHHLAVDGGSLVIIMNHIQNSYKTLSLGPVSRKDRLQPIDFAILENKKLLNKNMTQAALDYWVPMAKQTISFPMQMPYISMKQEGDVYGKRGMAVIAHQPTILQRVQDYVQKYNKDHDVLITPFVIFLASFQMALQQWSHSNVVNLGSLYVNRDASWLETIGPLFNTTVFSFDLGPFQDQEFTKLIEHVAPIIEDGRAHSWLPQGRLVGELRRQGNRIPKEGLYQVSFVYQNFQRSQDLQIGNSKVVSEDRYLDSDQMMAEFPLVVELDAATTTFGEKITEPMLAGLAFASDRFSEDVVQRLGDKWVHILETLFAEPEVSKEPIRNTVKLLPFEIDAIVANNNTAQPFETEVPYKNTVLYMLQKIATEEPNRIALRIEDQSMTYGEFWEEVQILANALVDKFNIQRDQVVCLSVQRSFNLIIGIWGIMLAGGIYCPIFPDEGGSRIQSILEITGCTVTLNDETSITNFAEFDVSANIMSDLMMPYRKSPRTMTEERVRAIEPSQGSYVVFTSGSTGKPKGVLMPHSALYNTVYARPVVKKDDVTLQFCRITFDVHIGDIFCPLCVGATLCLITEAMVLDFESVARCFEQYKVTTTQMVPSYAMRLFEFIERLPADRKIDVSTMRNMVTSGEKMDWALVNQLRRVLPENCGVINLYGPAEACVDATIYNTIISTTEPDPHSGSPSAPIGKPLPNYTCYILDKGLRPVSPGSEGELYIGGKGLFKGYINAPQLTNKALVRVTLPPEICGTNSNTPILYKTGDMVRQLSDGNIIFVGRADFQVKIRGQRVELGEIENAILQHETVKDIVCIVKAPTGSKELQLIAYVVPEAMPQSSDAYFDLDDSMLASLNAYCAKSLPSHMRPAIYVGLPELPLSQNMKVDRKQLPLPDVSSGKRSGGANANSGSSAILKLETNTEHTLAKLWKETLHMSADDAINASDDFFVIGGSSLSAAELVGLVRSTDLCADFVVIDVFENTKLIDMAAHIDSLLGIETTRKGGEGGATDGGNKRKIVQIATTAEDTLQGTPLSRPSRHAIQFMWWLFMMTVLGAGFIPVTQFLRLTINRHGTEDATANVIIFFTFVASAGFYGVYFAVFVLLVKWGLLGRSVPGTYRMWSPYMVRWWCVNNLVATSIKFIGFFLQDTALFQYWLRLLGANIGKNVIFDTTKLSQVDQLTIGDDCVVEGQSSIFCHSFTSINGEVALTIGPVEIGDRVLMNFKIAVEPDTIIPSDVELKSGATVSRHMKLEEETEYSNAPLEITGMTDRSNFHFRTDTRRAVTFSFTTTVLQVIGMFSYMCLWIGGLTLGLWPANETYRHVNELFGISILLAGTPVIMMAFYCYSLPVLKLLVLGRVSEGQYLLTSFMFARLWLMNRFMATSSWIFPSMGPPMVNNWIFRLMGLEYGEQCQATFANFSSVMELIKLGDRVWLGANNVVVPWYYEGSYLVFGEVNFRSGCVLSPNCISLAGAEVEPKGVLGPASVLGPNMTVKTGQVYMNRTVMINNPSSDTDVAKDSSFNYYFFQVKVVFLQIATFSLLVLCSYPSAIFYHEIMIDWSIDTWKLEVDPGHWFLIPMEQWGIFIIMLLVVFTLLVYTIVSAIFVKMVRNRDNTETKHFFNTRFLLFLWEGHLISFSLLSQIHASNLMLRGTELMPFLAGLFGAKVGKNIYWDSFQPTEFEMISVGDDSVLDMFDCVIHTVVGAGKTHVFTQEASSVGARCVLRPSSYPLPPFEMGDDCILGTNSIVMKGEALPDNAFTMGNPARVTVGSSTGDVKTKPTEVV